MRQDTMRRFGTNRRPSRYPTPHPLLPATVPREGILLQSDRLGVCDARHWRRLLAHSGSLHEESYWRLLNRSNGLTPMDQVRDMRSHYERTTTVSLRRSMGREELTVLRLGAKDLVLHNGLCQHQTLRAIELLATSCDAWECLYRLRSI